MTYSIFTAMKSFLLVGTFLIAIMFLIPKSVKGWKIWKKTGKYVHLSNSISAGVVAFLLLAGDFVTFMKAVLGY